MKQVVNENLARRICGNGQESLSFKRLNFTRNDFRRVLFGALGLLSSATCTVQFEPSGRFLDGGVTERDAGEQKMDTYDATPLPEDSAADVSGVDIRDAVADTGTTDVAIDAAIQDAGIADVDADVAIEDQDIGGTDAAVDAAAPDTGGPIVDVGEGEGQSGEGEGQFGDGEGEGPIPCPPDPCTVGRGVCERVGAVLCDEAGQIIGCDAIPGQPRDREICNSVDDDCDGQIDETFPEQNDGCEAGIGECSRQGNIICTGGRIQCDAVPGNPERELCNGIDDDCDGQIDIDPQTGNRITQICEGCGTQECQNDASYGPCGPDTDVDGRIDCRDNCQEVPNPDQQDANWNNRGDRCDAAMGNMGCTNTERNPSPVVQVVGDSHVRVFLEGECGNVWLHPEDGENPDVFYKNVPSNAGLNENGAHANVTARTRPPSNLRGCVGRTDFNDVPSIQASGNCFQVQVGP